MHFLLIHAYFLPPEAPGSIRWNEMSRLWTEAGHRLTVITGDIDYTTGNPYSKDTIRQENQEPQPGIRIIRVPMSRHYQHGPVGRLWAYLTFLLTSIWAGLTRCQEQVDALIATSPPLTVGITGWLLARWYGKPLILEIRDLWPDAPIQMGYLRHPVTQWLAFRLEAFLYQQAQHLVVLTSAFQQVLCERKRVSPNKITIIPNGADLPLVEQLCRQQHNRAFRQQHGMEEGFWIVYAGAHGPANGLSVLLQVADQLRQLPVYFLLIGDGPAKPRLQAEARRRQLPNIRFKDALTKKAVLPYILAADAGLVIMQPQSIFDTMLSAKLFDYMACQKPVLTAINGLSRSLITDANAGQFVDPANPDTWRSTIATYLANPDLAAQQGANGYQLVKQLYNRNSLAKHYLKILTHLCNMP